MRWRGQPKFVGLRMKFLGLQGFFRSLLPGLGAKEEYKLLYAPVESGPHIPGNGIPGDTHRDDGRLK